MLKDIGRNTVSLLLLLHAVAVTAVTAVAIVVIDADIYDVVYGRCSLTAFVV